jgi:hypothetical protein
MADRRTEAGMEPLKEYLASLPPGSVTDTARLEPILAECWDEFRGSGESGMHPGKLRGRMEEVTWNPPYLAFVIERHGATAFGSTRAEIQLWELDLQHLNPLRGTVPRPWQDTDTIVHRIYGIIA